MRCRNRHENMLYAGIWAFFYLIPILFEGVEVATHPSSSFEWQSLLCSYITLSIFCLTFWLHNLFAAPLVVFARRRWLYGFSVVVLMSLFGVSLYYFNFRGDHHGERHHHRRGRWERRERMEHSGEGGRTNDKAFRMSENAEPNVDASLDNPVGPPPEHRVGERKEPPAPDAFRLLTGREMMLCCVMVLLLALNLGIKYYFKSLDGQERLRNLEREKLKRQLAYLKYQISPHFFMNTLNNIHALVSIDPDKAERTIEILSKLMRYVLYEGDRPLTPLHKEVEFLRNYTELMRLRCADSVRIELSLPDDPPGLMMPPLLFVSFVENAFKHGVSYRESSFIEIELKVRDNRAFFTCRNSLHRNAKDEHGGVGLTNVRKRLELLFPDDHTLDIFAFSGIYTITLDIPLTPSVS